MKEEFEKKIILGNINRGLEIYKFILLPSSIVFTFFVFLAPYLLDISPAPFLSYLILFFVPISFFLSTLVFLKIKNKINELSSEQIQKLIVITRFLEISLISLSVWAFLSPTQEMSFFMFPIFLILFSINVLPCLSLKWIKFLIYYFIFLLIFIFSLGVLGFYLHPLSRPFLRYSPVAWASFFLCFISLFIVYNLMTHIWYREHVLKVKLKGICQKFKRKLQQNIKKFQEVLEESQVLRIREKAKTIDTERKLEELEQTRKALINILEDVEEARKIAEEERNKTLAIIQNFVDGLLVFNKEKKLFLVNSQAETFFGIKSEELIGKSPSELLNFSTLGSIVKTFGEELKEVFRKEVQIKENLILEVTSVSITRENEKIGDLVILRDVTREKFIEKMKSEFVSISAHQLRTPLSINKWILKMFLDGDFGEVSPKQKEYLEKTYQTNERMIRLVNDLLNVSRIEEGRFVYKMVLSDIVSICQSVINSCQEEIKRKNLELEFYKPPELPKINIDVEKISLALQNLIENAVRYTPKGGKISISLEPKENYIEFSIKDTGIGIPKDQQSRVFTKFFRGTNAVKLETEGSGLGLFIAKNIIEAHRGKIWFESEEGKGTEFYFTLPMGS